MEKKINALDHLRSSNQKLISCLAYRALVYREPSEIEIVAAVEYLRAGASVSELIAFIKHTISPKLQTSKALGQNTTSPRTSVEEPHLAHYRGSVDCLFETLICAPGELAVVRVRLNNRSLRTWASSGACPDMVSYHLLTAEGEIFNFDGLRTQLVRSVLPDTSVELDVCLEAPTTIGQYRLEITLVQESVVWFEQVGFLSATATLCVESATLAFSRSVSNKKTMPSFILSPTAASPQLVAPHAIHFSKLFVPSVSASDLS